MDKRSKATSLTTTAMTCIVSGNAIFYVFKKKVVVVVVVVVNQWWQKGRKVTSLILRVANDEPG